ncbi:MAG: OmpA family protein [Xanthomonadales bacterium]|nr:OmpA family protein [Xanthomonadales bacterium]
MNTLKRNLTLPLLVLLASGCATKQYVDEQVAALDTQLSGRLDAQDARITALTDTSRQALARAEEAGVLARGDFLYTVVMSDDGVTFDSEKAELTDAAKARLDRMAADLKADNLNVFLEIQGHTDATGDPAYNRWLGMERADTVKRHLHGQGVALARMSTISYGEDSPTAGNDTPEGRAANRRVEIVVLQ